MTGSARPSHGDTAISPRDRQQQRRWRFLGVLLLVVGLPMAAVIYHRADVPDEQAEYLVESGTLLSGNARQSQNDLRRIGGQSNVVAAEFSEWFISLWRGRRLAGTVAVLALVGSLTCFFAAHLLNFPPPPETQAGR